RSDGSGAKPFPGEVRIQGNRIAALARDGAGVPRDNARHVDAGGATLMPGLVEAHAHVSFANTPDLHSLGDIPPEEHTLLAAENARIYLDRGFTSLNSMAAAKPRLDIVIRNAIEAGQIPGPRMLAATPEMTPTAGLGDVRLYHRHRETFAVICDGPDEFRKTARTYVREGVDTLKINPSGDEFVPHARAEQTVMTEAEIDAVCEVGRAHGKRIAAHARSSNAVELCVKHGVQLINHATFADEKARDALEAAKDRVFVMPTIGITYSTLFEAQKWGITTEAATGMGMRREMEQGALAMRDLKKRGVRILPGGDYGFAWNRIGDDARDLEHFVNLFGFTPMEAIIAATRWGGEIMMKPGELGVIKQGALADLLLVDGDPSSDIKILQDPDRLLAIMKDGRFHKQPAARSQAAKSAA
ncbi:MAG TPA: amidohydrolase family protein, partial [Candidatus Polarisedimenticolia bacterium]|nr:amidohydrolase family protein [Candidatus Polarisedimenticolia bacterium]